MTVTAPIVSQMKKVGYQTYFIEYMYIFLLKSISEQDLVNVVPRNQKSRFGFVKKPSELPGIISNSNYSFLFYI
jgi:hypothetical protein